MDKLMRPIWFYWILGITFTYLLVRAKVGAEINWVATIVGIVVGLMSGVLSELAYLRAYNEPDAKLKANFRKVGKWVEKLPLVTLLLVFVLFDVWLFVWASVAFCWGSAVALSLVWGLKGIVMEWEDVA